MNNSSDRGDEIIHVIYLAILWDKTGYLTDWAGVGVGGEVETMMIITIATCRHGLTGNRELFYQLENYCRRLMDFLMTKCWSSGKYSLFLTGQSVTRPHGTEWDSAVQCSAVQCSAVQCSVQGWRWDHHYCGARAGHENLRLVAFRGRVAGADRRGRPGRQRLHHLQRVCLVDDKVALWLFLQWGTGNNHNTSREIHDGDIEEEIREAFRWRYWLKLWMTETIRLFENLCLSKVWLSMCP